VFNALTFVLSSFFGLVSDFCCRLGLRELFAATMSLRGVVFLGESVPGIRFIELRARVARRSETCF
jgi:hypothetical protein